jgi:predicted DNA-binding WGR domain protein
LRIREFDSLSPGSISQGKEVNNENEGGRVSTLRHCRLEFVEGTSSKFYEIMLVQDGPEFVVESIHGRIGSIIPNSGKGGRFTSQADAEKFYARLKHEKGRKGYVLVRESGGST